jgi:thymidylate synthase (FAD)
MLGVKIPVLDSNGWVQVVDYMGNDSSIAQAARVSYANQDTASSAGKDNALIRYLLRAKHTSPFEVCELRLHVKSPIFVARQWIRHRTASVNEISARYTVLPEVNYYPGRGRLVLQSKDNKQGSSTERLSDSQAEIVERRFVSATKAAYRAYRIACGAGLAKEVARVILPLSTFTVFSFKIDLHNLLHFLRLRLDPHAQYEIRVYAEAIWALVQRWVPATAAAFQDYALTAVSFSGPEGVVLSYMLSGHVPSTPVCEVTQREFREFYTRIGVSEDRARPYFSVLKPVKGDS